MRASLELALYNLESPPAFLMTLGRLGVCVLHLPSFSQVLFLLQFLVTAVSSIQCHFCYDTSTKEDCYITTKSCDSDYVCFIETSQISKTASHHYRRDETLTIYKMGCEHYILCRDKTLQGPSPYGYAVISHECCCDPLCEKADGVGKKQLDNCPRLWPNNTQSGLNSGASKMTRTEELMVMVLYLVCGIMFCIVD